MSAHSSNFFMPSSTAFGQNNTMASAVGLGFELPSEVLAATSRDAPMAGLGIFIDLPWFGAAGPWSVASPPMLAPRRSPRRLQLVDSPSTESAPMQTPSPSLRGTASDYASSTPSVEHSPMLPRVVGLGIGVLGIDVAEIAQSLHQGTHYPPTTGVGLGLELACLKGTELITTLEPQTTSQLGVSVDLSFLEDDALDAPDALDMTSLEQSMPKRAYHSLGFVLNEADNASPLQKSPTLGFDSPFWAQYATAMQEA